MQEPSVIPAVTMQQKRAAAHHQNHQQHQSFGLVTPALRSALLLGAAGGFLLAATLTITSAMHLPLGLWWAALAQAHGHLQLYGWAGLFVIGVALHFLPRLRGVPLAAPQLVPVLVAGQVVGLVLRAMSQPLFASTGFALWGVLLVVSGLLEMLALLGLVGVLVFTVRKRPPLRSRIGVRSIASFLLGVGASLALAAVVNLLNVWQAATQAAGLVPAVGDQLDVTLGLLGFLVPMALAMSVRSLPMYAGLESFPASLLWPLAGVYYTGLALFCARILTGDPWAPYLSGLGSLLIGGSLLLFIGLFLRTMRQRQRGKLPRRVLQLAPVPESATRSYREKVHTEAEIHGPFVALIASAYLWALLAGIFLIIDGIGLLVTGTAPIAIDGIRHSLAIGFVALLLCGVASRMLPGFSGKRIRSANLVRALLWLGNAAAILRVGSVIAIPLLASLGAGGSLVANLAFGLSGPLGLAFAICLAINLWPTLTASSAE